MLGDGKSWGSGWIGFANKKLLLPNPNLLNEGGLKEFWLNKVGLLKDEVDKGGMIGKDPVKSPGNIFVFTLTTSVVILFLLSNSSNSSFDRFCSGCFSKN